MSGAQTATQAAGAEATEGLSILDQVLDEVLRLVRFGLLGGAKHLIKNR